MTRTLSAPSTHEPQPIIEIEDLSFRYTDSERWVLRNVNMTVREGETVLILGPSGCGKSTLALCINGLIPSLIEGEMTGRVMWSASHSTAQKVGSVFQDPETQMVMPRVDEEVAFGLENLGVPAADMPSRIGAALQDVGLQAQARVWVDNLSGGQKQRLALAATLALQPDVLVLDEPTAYLDPQATVAFFATLARLKAEHGLTIVLIEHRLDAVLPLVDRIVAMNMQGEVIAQGTTHDVLSNHTAALQAEGVWLPMTCTLMRALAERGIETGDCPLTMDEVETSLRRLCTSPTSRQLWSATRACPATPGTPVVAEASMRRLECPIEHPMEHPMKRGELRGELQGRLSSHSTEPESGASAAVELADVTFAYPGGSPALRNINLRIERGRFVALVGANGSGKTTLAKHLVGLLRPTSGTVTVLGQDTARHSPAEMARQVGYVFQNPEHQFVTERVRDELAYSLRGRWNEEEIAARVASLLTTFGLQGYEDENPFNLSQGQKRRLSVATMVALNQPVLILDEPSFGQDQQSTAALMAKLRELHSKGVTIVFISHDMQLVAEYADEVVVLSEGRPVFQGSPRELFTRDDVMQQAALIRPPLAELAHRLGLPPLLTVEEWAACISGR